MLLALVKEYLKIGHITDEIREKALNSDKFGEP
jgi:hypothetical protein